MIGLKFIWKPKKSTSILAPAAPTRSLWTCKWPHAVPAASFKAILHSSPHTHSQFENLPHDACGGPWRCVLGENCQGRSRILGRNPRSARGKPSVPCAHPGLSWARPELPQSRSRAGIPQVSTSPLWDWDGNGAGSASHPTDRIPPGAPRTAPAGGSCPGSPDRPTAQDNRDSWKMSHSRARKNCLLSQKMRTQGS